MSSFLITKVIEVSATHAADICSAHTHTSAGVIDVWTGMLATVLQLCGHRIDHSSTRRLLARVTEETFGASVYTWALGWTKPWGGFLDPESARQMTRLLGEEIYQRFKASDDVALETSDNASPEASDGVALETSDDASPEASDNASPEASGISPVKDTA